MSTSIEPAPAQLVPEAYTLRMEGSLRVGSLERAFFKNGANPLAPQPIKFDLNHVEFIDVAALVYLVATFRARKAAGLETRLGLPAKKRVRDFLRTWQFPEAVRKATGDQLICFVDPDDRRYFGENAGPGDNYYSGRTRLIGGIEERILSKRFFAITTFESSYSPVDETLAVSTASHWRKTLIESVLREILGRHSGLFPSRIVYEAIRNAVMHPEASLIQTASFVTTNKQQEPTHFRMVFWDDGEGIVSTLRRAQSDQIEISTQVSPSLHSKIRYTRQSMYGEEEEPVTFATDMELNSETPEDLLMLAATFPGVTSRSNRRASGVQVEEVDGVPVNLKQPGMGLFVLANAAVKVFGGSVIIRSGNYQLKIDEGDEKHGYSIRLRDYGAWPSFRGNMLTVSLPLKK